MTRTCLLLLTGAALAAPVAVGPVLAQTTGQPPAAPTEPVVVSTNKPGFPSPEQPQQEQRLEYFEGAWTFRWTGRDTALGSGARSGTVTFTRIAGSPFLEMQVEGEAEGEGSYREKGVMGWDEAAKVLVLHEQLAGGLSVLSVGNWSSPLAVRFEVQPVTLDGQQLRVRRQYHIASAQGFTVAEEISIDGGPFVRLGAGEFRRQ